MLPLVVIIFFDRKKPLFFSKALKGISSIVFLKYNLRDLISQIKFLKPDAIILSGSAENRILDEKTAKIDPQIFYLNIPILGICYGYQLLVLHYFGKEYLKSYDDWFMKTVSVEIKKPFRLEKLEYKLFHHDDAINIKSSRYWKHLEFKTTDKDIFHSENEIIGIYNKSKKTMGIILHPEKVSETGPIFFKKWLKTFCLQKLI